VLVAGEKGASCQIKRVQCPRSARGSRQQGEIRLGEFLSPPEQVHGDKEVSIGKKRAPEFRHRDRIRHGATEKTRTAKSAVRAACFWGGQYLTPGVIMSGKMNPAYLGCRPLLPVVSSATSGEVEFASLWGCYSCGGLLDRGRSHKEGE
jgi:hypothetical protein